MFLGIDRLVVGAPDLASAAASLRAMLGVDVGSVDGAPRRGGLVARIAQLGSTRLEVVAVEDSIEAASSWLGRAVVGALADSPEGTFVGFALASENLAADATRRGWLPGAGPERLPGGGGLWPLAFGAQRSPERPEIGDLRIVRLEIAVEALRSVQDRWLRAFDLRFRPSLAGHGARDADAGRQTIRLVPSAGRGTPGLPATVVIAGASRSMEVDVAGCRFRLEDPRP